MELYYTIYDMRLIVDNTLDKYTEQALIVILKNNKESTYVALIFNLCQFL